MLFTILKPDLRTHAIIDDYESILWIERYAEYGEFELYTPLTKTMICALKLTYYIHLSDSDQVMVIEKIDIQTDAESGYHLVVTGRSLESILARRLIWNQTTVSGNFQNAVKKLLNENVISPSIAARAISNLEFETTSSSDITSLQIESTQFTGTNLYEAIKTLCDQVQAGFLLWLDGTTFKFKLYMGKDRTYNQTGRIPVIFSSKMDNLVSSEYTESYQEMKNVALVVGEKEVEHQSMGEGGETTTETERVPVTTVAGASNSSGLNRREIYVEANDVSNKSDDGETTISDAQHLQLLKQKGEEILAENGAEVTFEGQVVADSTFRYGKQYFMGDLVQIVTDFGVAATARITELMRSQTKDTFEVYPTFTLL